MAHAIPRVIGHRDSLAARLQEEWKSANIHAGSWVIRESWLRRGPMKTIVRIVALFAALLVSGSALAEQYPTRPVKIVIPFPPGGVTDIVGRLVAQKLSERLGQQFYIENIG